MFAYHEYQPAGPKGRPFAVLMLPGLFAGEWIWSRQVDFLRGHHFHLYAVEKPYCTSPQKLSTLDDVIGHTLPIIDAIPEGRVVLFGNSLGALVALRLATLRPQAIIGLVISGAPGLGDVSLGLDPRDALSLDFAWKVATKVFVNPNAVPRQDIERIFRDVATPAGLATMARLLRSVRHYDTAVLLPQVRQPVLLAWGEHDLITPPEPWREHLSAFPDAEMVSIEDSGHCPMIEQPALFGDLVLDFLDRLALDLAVTGPGLGEELLNETAGALP